MPSSAGGNIPSLNSDDTSNGGGGGGGAGGAAGEHLNNNNEVCDVPDDVANQKRHVSMSASAFAAQLTDGVYSKEYFFYVYILFISLVARTGACKQIG